VTGIGVTEMRIAIGPQIVGAMIKENPGRKRMTNPRRAKKMTARHLQRRIGRILTQNPVRVLPTKTALEANQSLRSQTRRPRRENLMM
jgi:hypothetical protein